MIDLKSCPFCGNAKIGVVRSKYNGVPPLVMTVGVLRSSVSAEPT